MRLYSADMERNEMAEGVGVRTAVVSSCPTSPVQFRLGGSTFLREDVLPGYSPSPCLTLVYIFLSDHLLVDDRCGLVLQINKNSYFKMTKHWILVAATYWPPKR